MADTEVPEWRSEASLARLPTIIDLLYGFAIGNGLSDTIKGRIESGSFLVWPVLLIAAVVAVAEWVAYHVHVSPIPYRSVARFLLDMTFPVFVYLILLAPIEFNVKRTAAYIPIVLFFYFALAVAYVVLMHREGVPRDPKLESKIKLCAGIVTAAALLCLIAVGWEGRLLPGVDTALYLAADAIALTAIAIWSAYNLGRLAETMREPRAPAATPNAAPARGRLRPSAG
jgi:hypothetical protein